MLLEVVGGVVVYKTALYGKVFLIFGTAIFINEGGKIIETAFNIIHSSSLPPPTTTSIRYIQ